MILLFIYSSFLEAPDTFLQVNCSPNFGRQTLEISQLCRSPRFYCLRLSSRSPKKCFFHPWLPVHQYLIFCGWSWEIIWTCRGINNFKWFLHSQAICIDSYQWINGFGMQNLCFSTAYHNLKCKMAKGRVVEQFNTTENKKQNIRRWWRQMRYLVWDLPSPVLLMKGHERCVCTGCHSLPVSLLCPS